MARPSNHYTSREKKEGRVFQTIFYDDESTPFKLARLSSFWDTFYYIYHNKDTWHEHDVDAWLAEHPDLDCPYNIGDLKKPHYHVIGVSSPCLLGRAAIKFDVPSNLVQKVDKRKEAIQYLIHLNNPEKYQYLPEEVVSNDPDVEKYFHLKLSSSEKAKVLFDFIENSGFLTFASLSSFALSEDCWDELRRAQHIFTSLLIEHNKGVL